MVEKFGRLSRENLQLLAKAVGIIERESRELKRQISDDPSKLKGFLTTPYFWSPFYEETPERLIAALVSCMGLGKDLHRLVQEPDPHFAIFEYFIFNEPNVDINPQFDAKVLLGLLWAVHKNIESICYYSKSLHELVQTVILGDQDDTAFFQAVLIDRTILSCPPFADRMALAEYTSDEAFFQALSKKLRQGRPSKHTKAHAPLRCCLYALEMEGALSTLSRRQAYELFAEELKLYREDDERSLWQLIARWRKHRST